MNKNCKFFDNARLFCGALSLFYFSIFHCGAQRTINGKILNEHNNPIPFATIVIKATSNVTYTNEDGYFEIICSFGDTIEVSAIGYQKSQAIISSSDITVTLPEEIRLLNEIIVTSDNFRTKEIFLGNYKKKSSGGFLGEYATLLQIENKKKIQGDIVKVIIKLYKKKRDKDSFSDYLNFSDFEFKKTLARLILLERNPIDYSFKSLLSTNVLKKIEPSEKIIEFDLDSLFIPMPLDNIYVGVEMLGYYNDDQFIPFDSEDDIIRIQQFRYELSSKHPKPMSWTKHGFGKEWKLNNIRDNTRGFINFNYGILVEKYESP